MIVYRTRGTNTQSASGGSRPATMLDGIRDGDVSELFLGCILHHGLIDDVQTVRMIYSSVPGRNLLLLQSRGCLDHRRKVELAPCADTVDRGGQTRRDTFVDKAIQVGYPQVQMMPFINLVKRTYLPTYYKHASTQYYM